MRYLRFVVTLLFFFGIAAAAAQPAPVVKGSTISDVTASLEILPTAKNAEIAVSGPSGQTWKAKGSWSMGNLPTGDYKVRVSAPGFETEDYVWKLEPDQKYRIKVELKKPGNLVVTGTPKGARIEIAGPDGFSTVQGLPVTVEGAPKGQYTVSASRKGYQTKEWRTEVTSGETTRLAIKLVREGELEIEWVRSRPAGVEFTKTEVTVAQYRLCIEAEACDGFNRKTASDISGCNWGAAGKELHPMNCVNWNGAAEFCKWAGGRLPTAAEWQAEAGNGSTREYPWSGDGATCDHAVWDNGSGGGCGMNSTWPVCGKPKGNSASGLCDMAGNVWEWTSTAHDNGYMLCGGSWLSREAESMRASERVWDGASNFSPANGFRCVRRVP